MHISWPVTIFSHPSTLKSQMAFAYSTFLSGKWIAKLHDHFEPMTITRFCISSSVTLPTSQKRYKLCSSSWSINGCQGDPKLSIGTVETQTLLPVSTLSLVMDCLNSAISNLKSDPPSFSSGIIRIQIPIQQQIEAIDWLHAQPHNPKLPRLFFSGRRKPNGSELFVEHTDGNGTSLSPNHDLISVAGVGAAVYFRHSRPFSFDDWRSIKRFLSKSCPLVRVYGAIRFDAKADVSMEWEPFGSFYFMVPQVSF